MKKVDNAVNTFKSGYSCSQSIISTYGPDLGLERELALRVGASFHGGIGMTGRTCGAVNGALIILGLKTAMVKLGDVESKEMNTKLTRNFINKFIEKFGSIECKDLLGCDIGSEEGLKKAKNNAMFQEKCPKFIEAAALILEELL